MAGWRRRDGGSGRNARGAVRRGNARGRGGFHDDVQVGIQNGRGHIGGVVDVDPFARGTVQCGGFGDNIRGGARAGFQTPQSDLGRAAAQRPLLRDVVAIQSLAQPLVPPGGTQVCSKLPVAVPAGSSRGGGRFGRRGGAVRDVVPGGDAQPRSRLDPPYCLD